MSKLLYPTPHIAATPEDIAKTVIMPGDPQRAKFIADNFLDRAVLFNDVRGICGYTGYYKDKRVSVMASGMGMPSIGIYSYELYNFFGVESIIRTGSAGAISEKLKLSDIVVGMGACTDSSYAYNFNLCGTFAPICDYELLKSTALIGEQMGLELHIGNLLSSDVFYSADLPDKNTMWRKMGVLAVEMEAAALYMNALRAGKKALAICSISDIIGSDAELSAKERETSFTDMMTLALEVAPQ